MNNIYLCHTKTTISEAEAHQIAQQYLSTKELAKATAMKDEQRRSLYKLAHGFKRKILAEVLKQHAAEIEFYTNANGKPFLVKRVGEPTLYFSLSYTNGCIALAVSNHVFTGIDVEAVTQRDDVDFLLQDILHCSESRHENERLPDFFYRTWVIKECFLKALGTGFSIVPSLLKIEQTAPQLYEVSIDNKDENHPLLITFCRIENVALAYTSAHGEEDKMYVYTFKNGDFEKT